ncbi:MAG: hypothetical protein M3Y57_20905 [Acidobacteriota bacterium]|nr:hypothetical protein [Acidobacteriota bacterium]
MKHKQLVIAIVACTFLSTDLLHAADLNDLKQACGNRRPSGRPGEHWLETCILDFFTLQPVHPAVNSIAPITGTGVGLGIDRVMRENRFEYLPSARALISTDGSLLFKGSLTIGIPGFIPGPPPTTAGSDNVEDINKSNIREMARVTDHPEVDAKASMTLHAERFDLMHQNFYGEGNSTTQSQLAIYRLQQTSGGLTAADPLTTWASASISADYVQPNILGATSTGRPSVVNTYMDASAPGLAHQPGFSRVQPSVRLLFKPAFAEFIDLRAAYAFYHATSGADYSFRQFTGSLAAQHKVRIQRQHTASHYNNLANALCSPLPAKQCSPGDISAMIFATTSQTSDNSAVPFFFQPTLGGANFEGEDTLRGYRDYRFRAPNVMGLQAEFTHQVWGPFGVFGFYDVGRVGLKTSDLGFSNFHHALGVGMYVSAGNIVAFRVSVGFGTHEGILANPKVASGLF